MNPEHPTKHIFHRCRVCEGDERSKRRPPNTNPRKFLVCEDGYHAICCECSYRIKIPQSKSERGGK